MCNIFLVFLRRNYLHFQEPSPFTSQCFSSFYRTKFKQRKHKIASGARGCIPRVSWQRCLLLCIWKSVTESHGVSQDAETLWEKVILEKASKQDKKHFSKGQSAHRQKCCWLWGNREGSPCLWYNKCYVEKQPPRAPSWVAEWSCPWPQAWDELNRPAGRRCSPRHGAYVVSEALSALSGKTQKSKHRAHPSALAALAQTGSSADTSGKTPSCGVRNKDASEGSGSCLSGRIQFALYLWNTEIFITGANMFHVCKNIFIKEHVQTPGAFSFYQLSKECRVCSEAGQYITTAIPASLRSNQAG